MNSGKNNTVKMRPEHLPEIMEIEKKSFCDPWSENMFREELKDDGRRISLVLESDGRIAGYAVGWLVLDEFHLGNIAVDDKIRGTGKGKLLLREILRQAFSAGCRIASLEVRMSNEKAIRLYRAFGFKPIAIRKKYYQDEDALVMLADIKGEERC